MMCLTLTTTNESGSDRSEKRAFIINTSPFIMQVQTADDTAPFLHSLLYLLHSLLTQSSYTVILTQGSSYTVLK